MYKESKAGDLYTPKCNTILIMGEIRFNIKVVCYGMSSHETSETQILYVS